jgi:GxxExxY protein
MGFGETTSDRIEAVAKVIVDAAFKVHRILGPGLLESVYVTCLAHELKMRGLKVARGVKVPIVYEGTELDAELRLDLLVEDLVIVEAKSVDKILPVFEAQSLTYLRLLRLRLCLLINFNVVLFKDGIKRIVL